MFNHDYFFPSLTEINTFCSEKNETIVEKSKEKKDKEDQSTSDNMEGKILILLHKIKFIT